MLRPWVVVADLNFGMSLLPECPAGSLSLEMKK
jgi:hypothetical protein